MLIVFLISQDNFASQIFYFSFDLIVFGNVNGVWQSALKKSQLPFHSFNTHKISVRACKGCGGRTPALSLSNVLYFDLIIQRDNDCYWSFATCIGKVSAASKQEAKAQSYF